VLLQAKDGRSMGRRVTANALKQAGGVMDHVRRHVDRGLRPGNKLPVVPNFFVIIDRLEFFSSLPPEVYDSARSAV